MNPMRGISSCTTIQTFTGLLFDPLNPRPELIQIEDIAHALSLGGRFTNHTRRAYSIAEHSIRVADECPAALRLEAILHDASEAYWPDIARPIKYHPAFDEYRRIEAGIEMAVAERFDLCYPLPMPVKEVDNLMAWAEADALMRHGSSWWTQQQAEHCKCRKPSCNPERYARIVGDIKGRPYSSHAAETAFLAYYESLKR
ncbi:MAG: phosphohydrolase [Cyanobacteria bacterium REEB65]|nr:phosphohydrolase [Cyanobacteria bacterium REEB65]